MLSHDHHVTYLIVVLPLLTPSIVMALHQYRYIYVGEHFQAERNIVTLYLL